MGPFDEAVKTAQLIRANNKVKWEADPSLHPLEAYVMVDRPTDQFKAAASVFSSGAADRGIFRIRLHWNGGQPILIGHPDPVVGDALDWNYAYRHFDLPSGGSSRERAEELSAQVDEVFKRFGEANKKKLDALAAGSLPH